MNEQKEQPARDGFFAAQHQCPRCWYSLISDPRNLITGYWGDESSCPACNYSFVD